MWARVIGCVPECWGACCTGKLSVLEVCSGITKCKVMKTARASVCVCVRARARALVNMIGGMNLVNDQLFGFRISKRGK